MAMGHSQWLHFGVDEHPFYFDVHQYRVLTHSHMGPSSWDPAGDRYRVKHFAAEGIFSLFEPTSIGNSRTKDPVLEVDHLVGNHLTKRDSGVQICQPAR